MSCGNKDCKEPNPKFYNNTWGTCITCRRKYQRKYKRNWLKHNIVNRDTLKEIIYTECENCNENLDGGGSQTCSVANGDEDIKLCVVWQEWKHSGIHPLPVESDYYYYDDDDGVYD